MKTNEPNRPSVLEAIERTDEHHLERHATFLKRIKAAPIDLLFLGDSITRRWAEVPDLWEYYFAKYNPANFGVGSDTTQNLKWRILNGELDGISPKAVVLLIGTNNLPLHDQAEITLAIRDLVAIIHQKLPATQIILMGVLPRNPDDSGSDYRETIGRINHALKELEKTGYVHFLDIGQALVDPSGTVPEQLMADGLHLVGPGYRIWGEMLAPVIEKYL